MQEDGSGFTPLLNNILSLGMITSWLPGDQKGLLGTLTIFLMGWLLEMGRNAYTWFSERWRFQYSLTAEFSEGDPAFDWILAFLSKQQAWRNSWNFKISAKTLQRKNGVEASQICKGHKSENAEYVPTYQNPQLFRWEGYWIEISKTLSSSSYNYQEDRSISSSTFYLTVYTRDVSVVSSLVEQARMEYMEMSQPHVIIHTSNRSYIPFYWNECKRKPRRSLESVILEEGVLDSLVFDAREFLGMEEWYQTTGIPYRRGYLLYGPPGSGKTSTVYALAGELELEIYSLSLASSSMDDSLLAAAVGCIPKRSIFLLEDIDCAFSRIDESNSTNSTRMYGMTPKCNVTLSGLLNVLDGVASQEGVLFFATTNHVEDLDNALIRPGRIDKKVRYHHAVQAQAAALYKRFYPISHCAPESASEDVSDEEKTVRIDDLAARFSQSIPDKTFTAAELQGFLLTCKFQPEKAVREVKDWADNTMKERLELEAKKTAKQEKVQAERDKEEIEKLRSTLVKMNGSTDLSRRIEKSSGKQDARGEGKPSPEQSCPGSGLSENGLDTWTIAEPDAHK
ncbi:hypothetical protein AGABI2DRAFT_180594 [Agaricus bisporus var. bisporus H97]|uniref:hypothetical protein n=1 Tax=Agaricus bisporus var. bisporus (strain H97 / ATCC MYA-4626 / FGSC 10389) TaxID=936046 RepID=UPI00029F7764|nr:hypothetical protein AGABI2DRAFT_180594 [Agaricus bisporus var. bisporus H97]EKV43411.1 hypothetical protein AGABI2DRAFT_180594 [Agaricus bisporus var. bisporus H97]